MRRFQRLVLSVIILGASVLLLPGIITVLYAQSRWFSVQTIPVKPVVIVFGAGLMPDGSPTPALEDRLTAAANLYFSGKTAKLLLSGDNRAANYNEPAAMQAYALKLGVPAQAIVLDSGGYRSYDTCYRAQQVFGVQEAILVTTDFHLPRALYLCNTLGIDAVGVATGWGSSPRGPRYFYGILREFPATLAAFWELYVSPPVVQQ